LFIVGSDELGNKELIALVMAEARAIGSGCCLILLTIARKTLNVPLSEFATIVALIDQIWGKLSETKKMQAYRRLIVFQRLCISFWLNYSTTQKVIE
jgi:hypothetical protein